MSAWNEKRFMNLLPSTKRIGPHNYEILCILIGSLLDDSTMEKKGNGSRFCFYQKGERSFNWIHEGFMVRVKNLSLVE